MKSSRFQNQRRKIIFASNNLDYLGLQITRQGIMPLPDKVQAIKHRVVSTNKNKLRSFIGVINYCRDMRKHC